MSQIRRILKFWFTIFIYLTVFYAVFDVYYTSPIIRGLHPIKAGLPPLATHLIVITSDGLRADKLFGDGPVHTPFFRDILLNHGVWGLSHTRAPTESRPAHNAILAGVYEDVAAVTKGWKANPVEFDHILNRSLRAWAWGDKNPTTNFVSKLTPHIKAFTYTNFMTNDLSRLDRWTVDHFLNFLNDPSSEFFADSSKPDSDRRGHTVFLHMGSAGMVGDLKKPNSEAYVEMINTLDGLIAKVVAAVRSASKGRSARVAYVFTADHGMTDGGVHGTGTIHETTTHLLAWGAGIRGPQVLPSKMSNLTGLDQYGLPLHNHGRHRYEVQQVDLCPLMASLLGVPYPSNSVGRLPHQLLLLNEHDKAILMRTNALQILAQLQVKYTEQKRSHFAIFFREFRELTSEDIVKRKTVAEQLTSQSNYKEAIQHYEKLTNLALDAVKYYHKYDHVFLGTCIGATFCLWSLVILCALVGDVKAETNVNPWPPKSWKLFCNLVTVLIVCLCLLVLSFAYLWPITHTIYQLLPPILLLSLTAFEGCQAQLFYLLCLLVQSGGPSVMSATSASGSSLITHHHHTLDQHTLSTFGLAKLVLTNRLMLLVASLSLLELVTWGFSYRPLLSIGCIIVAVWPYLDHSFGVTSTASLRYTWSVATISLGVFPLLPVIGSTFNPTLVFISGLASVPISLVVLHRLSPHQKAVSRAAANIWSNLPWVGRIFCVLFTIASISVITVNSSIESSQPIYQIIYVFSWSTFVLIPIGVLTMVPCQLGPRVFAWTSAFLVFFILMSTHYEVIFFIVFVCTGILWIKMEDCRMQSDSLWSFGTESQSEYQLNSTDLCTLKNSVFTIRNIRQAIFFLFFLALSFFGTGNIASVNSFDRRSMYCFVGEFNISVKVFILTAKILCPMLALGVIYAAVQLVSSETPHSSLSSHIHSVGTKQAVTVQTGLVASMSNLMVIHFIAWLRDEGSWLDIGRSICHYVIAMAIGLVTFLLASLGQRFLSSAICRRPLLSHPLLSRGKGN